MRHYPSSSSSSSSSPTSSLSSLFSFVSKKSNTPRNYIKTNHNKFYYNDDDDSDYRDRTYTDTDDGTDFSANITSDSKADSCSITSDNSGIHIVNGLIQPKVHTRQSAFPDRLISDTNNLALLPCIEKSIVSSSHLIT